MDLVLWLLQREIFIIRSQPPKYPPFELVPPSLSQTRPPSVPSTLVCDFFGHHRVYRFWELFWRMISPAFCSVWAGSELAS